jgi:hypothetical protein
MKIKTRILGVVVGLIMLALPMTALAHDHDGRHWGHHDNGPHYGWYKHHGWEREHCWPRYHSYYGGYDWRYREGNPAVVCNYNGYDCRPVPPIAVPWYSSYPY